MNRFTGLMIFIALGVGATFSVLTYLEERNSNNYVPEIRTQVALEWRECSEVEMKRLGFVKKEVYVRTVNSSNYLHMDMINTPTKWVDDRPFTAIGDEIRTKECRDATSGD